MGDIVAGVAMMRDEADVAEGVLRHMADEVDWLLVADNGSVDGTRQILEQLQTELPLTVIDDRDPAYRQSAKMSALAEQAADLGATWIVPFDADEIWYARGDRIREWLPRHGQWVVRASLYNHFCTAVDNLDPDPFRAMVWRQAAAAELPKVAFRWEAGAVIHQGNHGVTLLSDPSGLSFGTALSAELELRHFPYRSAEQMIRKAVNGGAAYAAAPELPYDQGAHWRSYAEIVRRQGPQALADVFGEHFFKRSPTDQQMVHDPAPYRRWLQ